VRRVAAGLAVWGLCGSMMMAQAAGPAAPSPAQTAKPQAQVPKPQATAANPQAPVDKSLTKAQETTLLSNMASTLNFVSKDTKLEIKHPVKGKFESRADISRMLRKKFDEDKDAKKMERDELVLKKFGLIDRDFHMRPFLLSLLTEQIAGFYDNKTQEMTLLDWVPMDQQIPVMAHELTHALQDQRVGLEKWGDQEKDGTAKDVAEDNAHIAVDEVDTAREAVLEGQAMVSFADYLINKEAPGKTLRDKPELAQMLMNGAGDSSDSPVLARAPLLLQQALLFPYREGLGFEAQVLALRGPTRAFAGVLDAPPTSSFEIIHPDKYLTHAPVPMLRMPDIHPLLAAEGWEPYDVGVMGELDVRIVTELFGGRPLADALSPNWDGGIYYAAQKRDASAADKETTKSIGLMYASRWKNEDSARNFFTVFEQELPRQYDGLARRPKEEAGDSERVYSTREGDVLLTVENNMVWVSEGFDVAMARKMRDAVVAVQGSGPMETASSGLSGARSGELVSGELVGGMSKLLGGLGALQAH
jgi:hypothetical protein